MSTVRLPRRYLLWRLAPLFAYLILVAGLALALAQLQQADRRSTEQRDELCRSASVNREALRGVYVDVSELGKQLVESDPGRVAQLDAFRESRLALLPPLPLACSK